MPKPDAHTGPFSALQLNGDGTVTARLEAQSTEYITFVYLNHRGHMSTRTVRRAGAQIIYWGNPEYGYAPGYFFEAYDMDRHALRSFALDNIQRNTGSGVGASDFLILKL